MAFKFDARFAIATAFSKQGRNLLHFEIQAVRDEDGDTVHCNDAEAEAWGIYARMEEPDGSEALAQWIADIDKQAQAQALCDLLNAAMEVDGYVSGMIESTIETISQFAELNYSIQEKGPDEWQLQIAGDGREIEFDYTSKIEAERDIQRLIKDFDDITFNLVDHAFTQG